MSDTGSDDTGTWNYKVHRRQRVLTTVKSQAFVQPSHPVELVGYLSGCQDAKFISLQWQVLIMACHCAWIFITVGGIQQSRI